MPSQKGDFFHSIVTVCALRILIQPNPLHVLYVCTNEIDKPVHFTTYRKLCLQQAQSNTFHFDVVRSPHLELEE